MVPLDDEAEAEADEAAAPVDEADEAEVVMRALDDEADDDEADDDEAADDDDDAADDDSVSPSDVMLNWLDWLRIDVVFELIRLIWKPLPSGHEPLEESRARGRSKDVRTGATTAERQKGGEGYDAPGERDSERAVRRRDVRLERLGRGGVRGLGGRKQQDGRSATRRCQP